MHILSVSFTFLLLCLSSLLWGINRNEIARQYAYCTSPEQLYRAAAQDSLDKKQLVLLLLDIAKNTKKTNLESARAFALEAQKLAFEYGLDKELADAYHSLGAIAWDKNNIDEATLHYYQALGLREQINDLAGLISSYLRIGYVFLRQKSYRDAEYHFNNAITTSKKIEDKEGAIDGQIALGALSLQLGQNEEAKQYFKDALIQAGQVNYIEGNVTALTFLGLQLLSVRDYEEARIYFSSALEKRRNQNDQYHVAKTLTLLAQSLLYKKDALYQSEQFAKESLILSEAMGLPTVQAETLAVLSEIYRKGKNFEQAYKTEKQRYQLHNHLTNETMERSITEVQMNFLKEKQRALDLKTANEILNDKQKITWLSQSLLFTTLLCVIIFTLVFYSRLRLQTRTNRLLESKNKELLETNSALERFAYVASHDLKEPLRTISSFTSLIARKYKPLLDDKGIEYINFVTKGVAHMSYLLEDLLRYSRLVNKREFISEPVNLNQIVEAVQNGLSQKIEERNAALKYPEMPVIYSNPIQMHQLFQNLISNGLTFNDKSSPMVEINYVKNENNYLFSFKDNGIGIEVQYHTKIFEMFQRLSKNKYPGTGIGLAICQKIVELNNGNLWLESTLGEGSTFYFTLPIEKAN